jgi:hypothetical protein
MTQYTLVLPKTFAYWQCLEELREGIKNRLISQGHEVSLKDAVYPGCAGIVLFGAHACPDADYTPGTIVYNSEARSSFHMQSQRYIDRLAQASEVWDWTTIAPLPWEVKCIGYHKVPGRVVHYGSLSTRRYKACRDVGAVVVVDQFGRERDKLVCSAELIIEPLYDESWEPCSLRLTHAVSNGIMILTECHPDPKWRLDLSRIKEQVEEILAMDSEARAAWLGNQRDVVENWLEIQNGR